MCVHVHTESRAFPPAMKMIPVFKNYQFRIGYRCERIPYI